jgi:broad specificity phosphatase PhoE
MPIILLRHAPPSKKYQKKYLGYSDISIDKTLFDIDKVQVLKEKKFDFVYASSLKRTSQTVELLGFKPIKDKRLNEVKFKDEIELKSFAEVEKLKSYKKEYLENFDTWHKYVCAESIDDFKSKIESFMSELPKDKEILICTHAGVLREITGKNMDYLESYELR